MGPLIIATKKIYLLMFNTEISGLISTAKRMEPTPRVLRYFDNVTESGRNSLTSLQCRWSYRTNAEAGGQGGKRASTRWTTNLSSKVNLPPRN